MGEEKAGGYLNKEEKDGGYLKNEERRSGGGSDGKINRGLTQRHRRRLQTEMAEKNKTGQGRIKCEPTIRWEE
jgi:hypothetical protein